ncbi:ABC transporter ATP-binding protein [Sneathiella limimaris]|uniref:ABC transporter ATP-binding protein n=1 Tax=Sneathiella limimaris TaxID=1964213 RepID=UPI00146BF6E6|nr:ABC transporter ATP-binding protein [Sneathiella limimaris]
MILFDRVSKGYPTKTGYREILKNISIALPTDKHIGILGRNGSGKSTILRMIGGSERPDKGRIRISNARVSWPLGFAGGFHAELTAKENIRFISRIYGANINYVTEFVEDFAEIGEYINMPIKTYSSGMRSRIAFGLSLAIDFDFYLIDEITSVGDQWFREKAQKAFAARRHRSGLIMVSHNPGTIRNYCDMGLVLRDSKFIVFEDLEDAISFYKKG